MKAEIEGTSIQHRGVVLISETEEEGRILKDIWSRKGRPVSVGKLPDGSLELVIAPTDNEEDDIAAGFLTMIYGRKEGD